MKKLKERWNIGSNWQLVSILLVFAITGTTSAKLATPATHFLGVNIELGWYIYWPIKLIIMTVIYQILLLFFGWLFGEFSFFLEFEKKMLRSMRLGFLIKE